MTVLCCGEPLIAVSPYPGGTLASAAECHLGEGGAELNVAVHLARLGVPVRYAGAVGADPFGDRVRAALRDEGVDVSGLVTDPDRPTGVYFKEPGGAGTRMLYYRDGSAGSDLSSLPGSALEGVDHVHLTGISAARTAGLSRIVHRLCHRQGHRARVVFDVNYRSALWPAATAGPVLLGLARAADLVLVGRDEAAAVWDADDRESIRALLPTVPELVVKDGAHDTHVWHEGRWVTTAPVGAGVVEPVGAGDAFAAAYLAARLRGGSPRSAAEAGHQLAGHVVGVANDQGVRGAGVYAALSASDRA